MLKEGGLLSDFSSLNGITKGYGTWRFALRTLGVVPVIISVLRRAMMFQLGSYSVDWSLSPIIYRLVEQLSIY